jgi:hypothetical protein
MADARGDVSVAVAEMNLRVFLSSTRQDLDAECRPLLLDAIALAEGVAISMETWDADYELAVELCRRKIEIESTHYLGAFAYYRGWVPPELGMSITEAEFTWARQHPERSQRMAVFVPKETSAYAQRLKEQVREMQDEAALVAQSEFLHRVMSGGVVQQFESPAHLGMRVVRSIERWANGSLRQRAAAPIAAPPVATTDRPTDHDLNGLGRERQIRKFEDRVRQLATSKQTKAACFVVHGQMGFGHDRLLGALCKVMDSATKGHARQYSFRIGPLWRQNGLVNLVNVIGSEVVPGWDGASVVDLSLHLAELLAHADIVVQITNVQRYSGGLEGFAEQFWAPLVAALGRPARRLICLVSIEAGGDPSGGSEEESGSHLLLSRLELLARLAPYSVEYLDAWLQTWLDPDAANALATTLIAETQGVPHLIYAALLDTSTWEQ